MQILHLTLKKQWFDMIASGIKKEEYREIKPYWSTRLLNRDYDQINFRNGYKKNAPRMLVEFKGLRADIGNIKWGAPPSSAVYIIKLGNILEA